MKAIGSPTLDWLSGKNKVVRINLNDSKSITEALSVFGNTRKEILENTANAMEKLVSSGEEYAKFIVPVDTGELADSITHNVETKGNHVIGTITAGTDHAMYVEFGTGIRGRAVHADDADQVGWVYDIHERNWQGMEARPFMYQTGKYLSENAVAIIKGE